MLLQNQQLPYELDITSVYRDNLSNETHFQVSVKKNNTVLLTIIYDKCLGSRFCQKPSNIQSLIEQLEFLEKYIKRKIEDNNEFSFDADIAFLTSLQNIIMEHLNESYLNRHFLSRKLGLSRMQLHRKIKALTGFSTNAFIQEIRLKKAHELLQEKSHTISSIAYQTGFSSLAYFSKVFKKRFNRAPSSVLSEQ